MSQIDKYSELKMYLPVLGHNHMQELADMWNCTVHSIRRVASGEMTSARLSTLIDEKIKEGEARFQEYRKCKASKETAEG